MKRCVHGAVQLASAGGRGGEEGEHAGRGMRNQPTLNDSLLP